MSKNLSLNIDIYKSLYLIRRVEERIRDLYFEDEMKTPMHMSMWEFVRRQVATARCLVLTALMLFI